MKEPHTLLALGDIGPRRVDPNTIFDLVSNTLRDADLVFGQLEPCLTQRGTPSPQARLAMRADPGVAQAINAAGIDVLSWASNHCLDWGRDGFTDTLKSLSQQNISVVGAGENIGAARQCVIKQLGSTRIAFLAYCSILPQDYWATEDRPGCAPMRAFTVNEQIEHDQPGTPRRQHTFAHRQDLQALINDVEQVKKQAEIVVVSCHWGLHFVPAALADYQRQVAHAAINAGANIIVGHHPHVLKGIEVYRGAVIFYSLGNFAIESPAAFKAGLEDSDSFREIKSLNANWIKKDKLLLPEDSLKTGVAKIEIGDGGIARVGFVPCYINDDAQPQILQPSDNQFTAVADYLDEITARVGLNTQFTLEENILWISV